MNAVMPPDDLSPAERKLAEHLQVIRDAPVEPSRALAPRVVRTARWQRAVRRPLQAVGRLAAAVADGLAIAVGLRSRRP